MTMHGNQQPDGCRNDRRRDRYPGRAIRWTIPFGAALLKLAHELANVWCVAWPYIAREVTGAVQFVQRRCRSRLSRRSRHAFVLVCGVSLAAVIGLSVRDADPEPVSDDPRPIVLRVTSRIEMARQPVVVGVRVSSVHNVISLSARERRILVRKAADKILPAIEADPRRVAVIQLLDLPLSFAALPYRDQRTLEVRLAGDSADRYETAVGELLDDLIDAIEREQPNAVLTVHGLPVEPEEAGMNLLSVQRTNERYGNVLERMGPFVPARRFVVFGSSLDEGSLATMGMREALRLRNGRPIIFQTNLEWRALIDEESQRGRDYQLETLLLD